VTSHDVRQTGLGIGEHHDYQPRTFGMLLPYCAILLSAISPTTAGSRMAGQPHDADRAVGAGRCQLAGQLASGEPCGRGEARPLAHARYRRVAALPALSAGLAAIDREHPAIASSPVG
jgi:hypothetical protein